MSDWTSAQRASQQPHVHTLRDYEGPPLPSPTAVHSEPCEWDLCATMRRMTEHGGGMSPTASVHTIPARRAISHPAEWSESVPVVGRGWAMSSLALPDGRRQILSFL